MGKARRSGTSELDRLRAEFLLEQDGRPEPAAAAPAGQPAPAPAKRAAGAAAGRSPGRPRTAARLAAVQALYQSEYNDEPAELVIEQFRRHRLRPDGAYDDGTIPEANAGLFAAIVSHAGRQGAEIDALIAGLLARDWPLAKLDPVLRALLRAATAELQSSGNPPARVIINEYLDIAHGFFGGDEPRFANGVLNALARALRPGEFGERR